MKATRVVSAVGLAAAGILLAGCSADRSEDLPPTDDPVVWASRLCSSLTPLATMRNLRPNFDIQDPAVGRESLSSYFADTEARIGDSLAGLEQVGPSPIQGGDEVGTRMKEALERMRTASARAREKVEAVDPEDPEELVAKLPDILMPLAEVSAERQLAGLVGTNAALDAAIRESPSCGMLAGPGGEPAMPGSPGN